MATVKLGAAPKNYAVGEMSKKARELALSLAKLGCDAPTLLRAGRMPIPDYERLTYFKMACAMLLADKCLNREKLRDEYMDKLGWTSETANSHLSILASYFMGSGVLALDGTTYLKVVS